MTLRHGMTNTMIEDFLKFVNKIVGDMTKLCHALNTCFKHFFLKEQLWKFNFTVLLVAFIWVQNFKDREVVCSSCDYRSPASSMKARHFSFDIKNQIKDVLRRPDININLNGHINADNIIRDTYDGTIYQFLKQENIRKNALTITFNKDGASLFQCTGGSLWPIFYTINEIIPSQRFGPEHVFLAGLWFGNKSPIMDVFFKPFVTELVDLAKSGIFWDCPGRGIIESTVYAICLSQTRYPKVQNIIQYNGTFGCGYCYHPNVPIVINNETGRTALKYVPHKIYAYRSDRKIRKDMRRKKY